MDSRSMLEPSSVLLHEELFSAAERDDVEALRWMLAADSSAAHTARREGAGGRRQIQSPLLAACAAGATGTVELLCAHLSRSGVAAEQVEVGCDDATLHAAVRPGHEQVVQLLLSKLGPPGLDVNVQTKDGSTAFSLACRHGQAAIARLLHNRGADTELVTHRGATPFLIACQEGHAALAEWLARDCGADVFKAADGGFTPMYMACQNGHVNVVQTLVGLGLPRTADSDNTFGTSPLYIAAQNGHLPLLRYLVGQQIVRGLGWLHQSENNGATPFYIACEQGHVDVARYLAQSNADVEAPNANSSSPLFIACLKGHLPMVELLVNDLHVDCEQSNSNGASPFYVSCEKGHLEIIRFLGSRVNVSTTNTNGVSPLWIACQDGHLPVVQYCAALAPELLEKPKASGATPFCIACHQGHLLVAEYLASEGVDMERPNHNGSTPLFYAATNGHLDVVKMLLSRGVCADTADAEGMSPLHAACRQGHLLVAEALADHGVSIDTPASNGQSALDVAVAHERRSVVSWLSHIQSVPATTTKLVAALQRQAWAMLSITSGISDLLSYDLLELSGKNIPIRVSWQFAMRLLGAPSGRNFKSPVQTMARPIEDEAHGDATEGVDVATLQLIPPPASSLSRPLPCQPTLRGGAASEGGGATRSRPVEGERSDAVPPLLHAAGIDVDGAGETERTERSSTA